MATWDGRVAEVDGDMFTAFITRQDGTGPELIADFSMSQCGIKVEEGDLIIVTPDSVTVRDPGTWTRADICAIRLRAGRRARRMRRNVL